MALEITVSVQENGSLLVAAGGTGSGNKWSFGQEVSILPYTKHGSADLIAINTSGKDDDGTLINWNDIVSPVVTSRVDAIAKIALLVSRGGGIQSFTTAGGSGSDVTITNFTLSGNYIIFVDGVKLTSGYTSDGQVITFDPVISDGKIIDVIKI